MNAKHQVGDPVFWLKDGVFGYISDMNYDKKLDETFYVITWFLSEEVESAWLEEQFVDESKRDLQIYLGEIPPTQVR